MKLGKIVLVGAAAMALWGCVTPPLGPTIPVMPGPKKSFDAFQQDDMACQDFAGARVNPGVKRANDRAVTEGILGTALGAGLGAAIGGGRGAGIGAASGAVVGTAVGANTSGRAQYGLQQRYNIAYAQCMTSKGNRVNAAYPPPPSYGYGPPPPYGYGPPPGYYPPPPPPPPPY